MLMIRDYTMTVFDPDDLDSIHDCLMSSDVVAVSDEVRVIVEVNWPEFIEKLLPPRERMH